MSSPQDKPAWTATAEIMLRYISGPRQAWRHRAVELRQWKWHKSETKKAFHDSPLCRQAKWSVNMKARLSMKKREKLKHNHLRCFSDDGWMMKEHQGAGREQTRSGCRAFENQLGECRAASRVYVCVTVHVCVCVLSICVCVVCFDLFTDHCSKGCG